MPPIDPLKNGHVCETYRHLWVRRKKDQLLVAVRYLNINQHQRYKRSTWFIGMVHWWLIDG